MSSESSGNLAILRYVFVPTMPLCGVVMNKHDPDPALAERIKDDDEIQRLTEIERIANGKPSYFDMDAAFCARMHAAIAAGLESAPTSVITTPGTKNRDTSWTKLRDIIARATSGDKALTHDG
jgi:hypothetical protein